MPKIRLRRGSIRFRGAGGSLTQRQHGHPTFTPQTVARNLEICIRLADLLSVHLTGWETQPLRVIFMNHLQLTTKLFFQRSIMQKTPENTYDDRVYSTHPKITQKQKKIPFGIFFARNLSLVYFKISGYALEKKRKFTSHSASHVGSARHM